MNEALIKSILGKFEKSFNEDGFAINGSAGYDKDTLIENTNIHALRYLTSTYTYINRVLNKKPNVNYLDPNDDMYDESILDFGKGSSNFPLENLVSDILNIVKDMKPMKNDTTLYRGTFDHYYPMLDDAIVGETINLRGITSTSTSQEVANTFADNYDGSSNQGSLIFKINAPKGMPSLSVKTNLYDEGEVILHPAKYKITDIETHKLKNGQVRIVSLTPTELLDIKKLILDGLTQAKENQENPVNKWIIERNRDTLESLNINPDTAIDDLRSRVLATASPRPQTGYLQEPESM